MRLLQTIPQQLQQQQPALPAKIILSDEVIRATLSTSPKPATKTQSSVSEVVEETPRPVLASSRLAPTAFSKQSPPPQPQLPTKPSIAPSWASKKPPQASDADSSDDDRRQPPIQPPVTRPSVTLSSKLRSPPESFSMVPRKDVAKNNKENFVHPLGGFMKKTTTTQPVPQETRWLRPVVEDGRKPVETAKTVDLTLSLTPIKTSGLTSIPGTPPTVRKIVPLSQLIAGPAKTTAPPPVNTTQDDEDEGVLNELIGMLHPDVGEEMTDAELGMTVEGYLRGVAKREMEAMRRACGVVVEAMGEEAGRVREGMVKALGLK